MVKAAILGRNAGEWYICFQIELRDTEPLERQINPVGIDVGLSHFVALSTGETMPAPPHAALATELASMPRASLLMFKSSIAIVGEPRHPRTRNVVPNPGAGWQPRHATSQRLFALRCRLLRSGANRAACRKGCPEQPSPGVAVDTSHLLQSDQEIVSHAVRAARDPSNIRDRHKSCTAVALVGRMRARTE
jgi:hypothetical protein